MKRRQVPVYAFRPVFEAACDAVRLPAANRAVAWDSCFRRSDSGKLTMRAVRCYEALLRSYR